MKQKQSISTCLLCWLVPIILGLNACSSVGPQAVDTDITAPTKDDLSGFNKASADFNRTMDKIILKPIAGGYKAITPKPARQGLSNVLKNLMEPWTIINEMLQLNFKGAAHSSKRFVVNTTLGIGGLFDQATDMNLPRHKEDFGQTLAVWGMTPGTYIVLPFIGPSNIRDTIGFGVDFFFEPINYILHDQGYHAEAYIRTGLQVIDFRASNYDAVNDYLYRADSYDRMKLFYEQTRAFQIRNGLTASDAEDDFFFEEEDLACYPADEAIEGDVICPAD